LFPGEFVSVRDLRVSQAKKAGDRDLATAIKQLRRPTTGAWLANLLVRERRDRVNDLLDLGDALRQAQKELAGSDLRRLSQQRRQLVSALGDEAGVIAGESGHQVNESGIQDLEATLEAALADGAAAEALRTGSLTVGLRYSGFGSVDLSGAVAAPEGRRPAPASRPDPPKRNREKSSPSVSKPSAKERRLKERLEQAEDLVLHTRSALAVAEQAASDSEDRLAETRRKRAQLEDRISALEQQLRALREDHDQARRAERAALKELELAQRNRARAQGRLAEVTTELEGLQSPEP
jgi:chromosome segregation ATPase